MTSVLCGFGFQIYCVRLASSSISSFFACAFLIFQIILFQNGRQHQNDESPEEETLRTTTLTCCNLHSCLLMDRDCTSACIIYLMHVYNTLNHILSPFTFSPITLILQIPFTAPTSSLHYLHVLISLRF